MIHYLRMRSYTTRKHDRDVEVLFSDRIKAVYEANNKLVDVNK